MPSVSTTLKPAPLVPLRPVERDTIPKIFLAAVDRYGREALRWKEGGAWKGLSHAEVEARAAAVAAALHARGIGAGERVALLSENRPEWTITDYAVTGTGGIDVPVYPTLPANQIAYILGDCEAKAVFVSTREQLAKIREIRGELSSLTTVVVFDAAAAGPDELSFDALLAEGRAAIAAGGVPDFRSLAAKVTRDDVATLIYTSGTTGQPKGVMLTHYNLASNVAAAFQHGLDQMIRSGDVTLSFLPLSHVFERMVDYLYWDVGATIAYAESIDKVADNLNEVHPNIAVSVPRLFEKIYTKVVGATGIKKKLVDWAKRTGEAVVDLRLSGREPSGALAFQNRIADRLVFSKLRAKTGGSLRCFVSGGAPLSPDIARFFFAAGLPVYEGYGLTETSPVIAVNRPGAVQLGSVGKPLPGIEVAIDTATGEILTRGPHVMKGYWKNDAATAEAVDADGWFHTGDIGEVTADGFLRITDRLKNIIVTAGGKNVAPQPMENLAVMSPYVAQVVMLGDERAFPVLLVVPEWDNLDAWCAQNGVTAAARPEKAADLRVVALLEKETIGRLDGFARYELPKKILVLTEEFTIDGGLLTPSLKVKRKAVEQHYRDRIEALYAAAPAGE